MVSSGPVCFIGRVHCLVTAGPTIEPLDAVRRLTNHATGHLGCSLADSLARAGHRVTLMLSETARHQPRQNSVRILPFNTTEDLRRQLRAAASPRIRAIYHTAAVSDFRLTNLRHDSGKKVSGGKIPSGPLVADLKPTPKIIRQLRRWFPRAFITGWKFEVDGNRDTVLARAHEQINQCHTDACVANGPAYGDGFGIVTPEEVRHVKSRRALVRALTSAR
ncbi:MAG: phosphopantothenoylcysteine decarboxylase [Verrucomicrobiota bacterium]|nr:phosphopantothenoylcysteine decarboxylase [Verrucomicrobiota bacterium]